jgi:outer membrane protein assembly factor BamB
LRLSCRRSIATALVLFGSLGCTSSGDEDVLASPRLAWRVAINDGNPDGEWGGIPAVAGGKLFFAELGRITAIDAATGKRQWSTLVRNNPATVAAKIITRGNQVFFADAPDVFSLDANDGRILWTFEPDSEASISQGSADDRAVYVGTRTHKVYALDVHDGHPIWIKDVGEGWAYSGYVEGTAFSGDTVYVTTTRYLAQNGYLRSAVVTALRRLDGKELWRYETPGQHRDVVNAPVVAGRNLIMNDVVFASVFAVDRFTGKEVWRIEADAGRYGSQDPLVIIGDTAFLASNDTHVYALRPRDGHIYWRSENETGSFTSGVPCGNFVLANAQGVMVYERATGKYLGKLPTKNDIGTVWFPTSHFATDGRRAYITGILWAWAFEC